MIRVSEAQQSYYCDDCMEYTRKREAHVESPRWQGDSCAVRCWVCGTILDIIDSGERRTNGTMEN